MILYTCHCLLMFLLNDAAKVMAFFLPPNFFCFFSIIFSFYANNMRSYFFLLLLPERNLSVNKLILNNLIIIMPINRNALIRYKTIDQSLQNRYRKWTLEDLIEACREALYEFEGIEDGVSKRTIQGDIQVMRSEKLGYNAPIVVVDKKYYTYEDADYSITNIPLTAQDLQKLGEVTEILKQFKGFSHFHDLGVMVQKLEDKVSATQSQQTPVIDMEKNENLHGLGYIEIIFRAIKERRVLDIYYQSFKAKRPGKIVFHPYLLKEYRNRWFVVGSKGGESSQMNLALDRIKEIDINNESSFYQNPDFDAITYFDDVIGVTVTKMRPMNVHLLFNSYHANYVLTKPLHHTQKVIAEHEDGIEVSIKVQLNYELEREILGFGGGVKVLAPEKLKKAIIYELSKAIKSYGETT
jgi:predicted DNA-binding transcriptional regulator YafY